MLLQTCLNLNISTNETLQSNKGYQNNLSIVSDIQIKPGKNFMRKCVGHSLNAFLQKCNKILSLILLLEADFCRCIFRINLSMAVTCYFVSPYPLNGDAIYESTSYKSKTCYLTSDSRVINSWSPLTSLTDINQQETKQSSVLHRNLVQ